MKHAQTKDRVRTREGKCFEGVILPDPRGVGNGGLQGVCAAEYQGNRKMAGGEPTKQLLWYPVNVRT